MGGGFSTVPAYLADTFGTKFVGASHGRILTAWSLAGVLGPFIVTSMRAHQIAEGIPRDQVYQPIYWVLAGLLVVAFLANLLIRPVHARFHMAAGETSLPVNIAVADASSAEAGAPGGMSGPALLAWAAVCLPIAWAIYETVAKAVVLFR